LLLVEVAVQVLMDLVEEVQVAIVPQLVFLYLMQLYQLQ
jgi:hypothetical protein